MNDVGMAKDLYQRLLAINQDAFDAGFFSAAYHALSGALDCARSLPTDEPFQKVEQVATEQLTWIDQNAPEYEQSTPSAATRGNQSIFMLLSHQAHAAVLGRHADRMRKEAAQSDSTH